MAFAIDLVNFVNLLTMTIFVIATRDVCGSICSSTAEENGLSTATMCKQTTVNGSRIVIDTYESESSGEDSCSCTGIVSSTITDTTNVNIFRLGNMEPGVAGCGSNVELSVGKSSSIAECTLSGSQSVSKDDTVVIKWNKEKNSINSKYCIFLYFSNTDDFTITVTCSAATTTTTASETTTVNPVTTTNTAPTTTTTQPSDVSDTTPSIGSSVTASELQSTHKPNTGASRKTDDTSLPIEVVAPVAGGAVVVIIIVIVVAVICTRKKPRDTGSTQHNDKQNITAGEYDNVTNPFVFENKALSSDDHSGVIQNQLYVSAEDVAVIDNSGTNSSNVYAEVQTKPNAKEDTNHEQGGEELMNLNSQGHIYAVVNKPKLNKSSNDNNEPSRYKNQEGLVYVEVDVQSCDTSFPPIPPPKRFSDPPDEQNHVVYSEIATEL